MKIPGIGKADWIDPAGENKKASRVVKMKLEARKKMRASPAGWHGLALKRGGGTLWKIYFPALEIRTRSVVSGP